MTPRTKFFLNDIQYVTPYQMLFVINCELDCSDSLNSDLASFTAELALCLYLKDTRHWSC